MDLIWRTYDLSISCVVLNSLSASSLFLFRIFYSWSTPYSQHTSLHNDSEIWNVIKYLQYFCPNPTINRKALNIFEFNLNKKTITCIIIRQNKYCHYDKVSIVQNTFSFLSAPKVVILEIPYTSTLQ